MKVSELIAILQEQQEILGGDPEVRLATQPNYPLAAGLAGAYMDEEGGKVWLAEGGLPYAENPYAVPRDTWEEAWAHSDW